jgi:hypothetical protein
VPESNFHVAHAGPGAVRRQRHDGVKLIGAVSHAGTWHGGPFRSVPAHGQGDPTAQASFVASAEAPRRGVSPDTSVEAVHEVESQCSKRNSSGWSPSANKLPAAQISSDATVAIALKLGSSSDWKEGGRET